MSDEEQECPPCVPGLPAWLATFGDLMSLLMCFFVLLLSFSEMDVLKFKQLAGSMREAFGVQNQIKAEDVPKGTSIIAQEFSPGRPEPTPLNEVRQMTVNNDMNTLDIRSKEGESTNLDKMLADENAQAEAEAKKQAVQVATALAKEIGDGSVEVETDQRKVIIRVKEKGSFSSGSAQIKSAYIPVMEKIRDILLDIGSDVSIEGHTDDIPYSGRSFASNWDLSSARALAVANELFADRRIDQSRYQVIGHADTHPLVPNDTAVNRSTNRRVEIVIQRGSDKELLEKIKAQGLDNGSNDNLAPNEIF